MIFYCARSTRAFSGRALREHGRSSGSIPSFSSCAFCEQGGHLATFSSSLSFSYSSPSLPGGTRAPAGHPCLLQLRPSNEALPRARVPGARGNMGVLPLSALASPSPTPVQYVFPVTPWLSDSFSSFRDSAQVRRRNQISMRVECRRNEVGSCNSTLLVAIRSRPYMGHAISDLIGLRPISTRL